MLLACHHQTVSSYLSSYGRWCLPFRLYLKNSVFFVLLSKYNLMYPTVSGSTRRPRSLSLWFPLFLV
nr:MAG TPA: hypothetical protein [Caudoviricetes sp.]